mgnify:CR=1 FL=1|jgi:uncharacterized protein YbaR (Trm112 family)
MNLPNIIKKAGHKIIKNELTGFNFNKNNQNSIIVSEKKQTKKIHNVPTFISPISKKSMNRKKEFFYCKYDGYAFPIINKIPCLVENNGILVSKLENFN